MLRYFTVYGPHQRADMLIARVIDAALRSKHVTINGDGSARRDFTYVSDAVRATFLALSPVEMANPVEAVNVGSGTCSSVRDVIGLVEAVAGRNIDVKYRRPGSGDVSRTLADVTKARRMLGYYPTVSLRTGVIHQFDAAAALLR